jgi:lysophospholipase L1-like esterase
MNERRGNWLAALVSILVTLAVVEVGWRVYLFGFASERRLAKYARYSDMPEHAVKAISHPYLVYAPNPAYRSSDGLNRHNSLGFRGAEFPVEKPPGVYRVVCIGGSSTYDNDVRDDSLTWTAQLERILREDYRRPEIHVINAGYGGYTTWESVNNLQFRVLDLEPDLVIIYNATNDVKARLVPPEAYRRDNTARRRAWRQDLRWWDHSLFLHYLGVRWGFSQRSHLADWVNVPKREENESFETLAANPPIYFRANLESMVAIARQHGAEVLLTSWAWSPHLDDYASEALFQQGFREHNEVSRRVALENDVPFYDFAAEMPQDPEYWSDGRHSSEKGARRKAELFAAFLDARVLPRR